MNSRFPKIILIEDNTDDAELTGIALERCGYYDDTLWLKDGVEAHDFFLLNDEDSDGIQRSDIRLVFLDLKMPRMNGFDFLKKLRAHERYKFLPVSVLSSSGVDMDVKKSLEIGANSYIVKPIDFKAQTASIKKACDFWIDTHVSAEEV